MRLKLRHLMLLVYLAALALAGVEFYRRWPRPQPRVRLIVQQTVTRYYTEQELPGPGCPWDRR